MGRICIGVSGWRYTPWRGNFYPKKLAQARELEYASRVFSSIELNGSFYSLQRPSSYAQWAQQTPPGFVFAVKGGRYITHMLRLRNAETAIANFFASGLFELGDKLGPILWQFPPNMAFDPDLFEAFFRLLPKTTVAAAALAQQRDKRMHARESLEPQANHRLRHAIEVRHESFVTPAFIALLRKHRKDPPPARGSRDVYCYFDNTDKLHAPNNAAELMFKLGLRDSPVIEDHQKRCASTRPFSTWAI